MGKPEEQPDYVTSGDTLLCSASMRQGFANVFHATVPKPKVNLSMYLPVLLLYSRTYKNWWRTIPNVCAFVRQTNALSMSPQNSPSVVGRREVPGCPGGHTTRGCDRISRRTWPAPPPKLEIDLRRAEDNLALRYLPRGNEYWNLYAVKQNRPSMMRLAANTRSARSL